MIGSVRGRAKSLLIGFKKGGNMDGLTTPRWRKINEYHSNYVLRTNRRMKAERLRRSLERVIPPLFASAHLRDLNQTFRRALLDFDRRVGLVLFGPAGRGKSFAMAALARYLILRGKKCERIAYEMLCLQIRNTYKQGSGQTD